MKRNELHSSAIHNANVALELFGECFAAITEGRIEWARGRFGLVEHYADECSARMAEAKKKRGHWCPMVFDDVSGRWLRPDQTRRTGT